MADFFKDSSFKEYTVVFADIRTVFAPKERGKAPIGKDGYSVELHHTDQTEAGPIDEMTRTDHRLGDNYQKNHQNTGQESSNINRSNFGPLRSRHWEGQWEAGRFTNLPTQP